jgi:DUF971 family protein
MAFRLCWRVKPARSTVSEAWPTALKVKDKGTKFSITFDSGDSYELSAEYLRVESPSAEVKGHGPGQEQLVWGKRHVSISKAEPIGSYAIRLIFSDGHSTGLFTWNYLAKLGREQDEIWKAYEAKLVAEGKSRG